MNKLFADGGMMDDSGEQVNGVEVPPGSLREEVADDIPAQLSEGEFVVPADVVRYIGLEKLMAMRDKAKQGLERMEEMGQMGNADEVANPDQTFNEQGDEDFAAEIDDIMAEEGEGYAKGGEVTADNVEKFEWAKNPGVDVRYFKHEDGRVMFITYINGRPTTAIPEGFTQADTPVEKLVGKAADDKAATTAPPVSGGEGTAGDGADVNDGNDGRSPDPKGAYSDFLSTPLGKVVARTVNTLTPGPSTQVPAPTVNLSTPFGVTPARGSDGSAPVVSSQDTGGVLDGATSGPNAFSPGGGFSTGPGATSGPNAFSPGGGFSTGPGTTSGRGSTSRGGGRTGADTADPGVPSAPAPTPAPAPSSNPNVYSSSPSGGESSSGSDTAGIGAGADSNATYICTASYNQDMITPSHFRSLSGYGARLRKQDPYLMRAYDSFGPFLASHVGKNKVMTGVAKYLTNYWKDIHKNNVLSTKHMIQLKASTYVLRPVVRFFGWVLIKFVDKK